MKDKETVSPKPDFEQLAEQWSDRSCIYRQHLKEHYAAAFEAGQRISWRDYVLPLQSRIAELEKELSDTKADLGRAYNGIQHRDTRLRAANQFLERENMGVRF